MIFSKANRQQFYYIALGLVACSIPFFFILSSISAIILCAAWLVTGDLKDKFVRLQERKILWVWIFFYILHAISYLYSEDKGQSAFDLQRKLSILVLPLVVGTMSPLSNLILSRIIKAFIASVTLAGLIFLGHASYIYFKTGIESHFFYHELVKGSDTNAVYYAWYYFFSLSALLLFDWPLTTRKWRWFFVGLVIFQTVFFLLLSSKSLIILFLFLSYPAYLIKEYRRRERGALRLLVPCLTGVLVVGVLFFTKNPIRDRYADILTQKTPKIENSISKERFNNLTLRLFLWKTGIENVNDNHLWLYGCGNGDLQQLQEEKVHEYSNQLSEWDIHEGELSTYNMHNMFLQSLVTLGLPGLTLFIIVMVAPFFAVAKTRDYWIALVFHIPAVLFMMQEAAFQTHAGVMFFSFFSILFWNYFYGRSGENAENAP